MQTLPQISELAKEFVTLEEARALFGGDLDPQIIEACQFQGFSFVAPDGRTWTWNIDAVMELIMRVDGKNLRPIRALSLADAGMTNPLDVARCSEVDPRYAMTTDVLLPLFVVPSPMPECEGQYQIIDGWHRLFKAAILRLPCVPYLLLTKEESEACMVRRP